MCPRHTHVISNTVYVQTQVNNVKQRVHTYTNTQQWHIVITNWECLTEPNLSATEYNSQHHRQRSQNCNQINPEE